MAHFGRLATRLRPSVIISCEMWITLSCEEINLQYIPDAWKPDFAIQLN